MTLVAKNLVSVRCVCVFCKFVKFENFSASVCCPNAFVLEWCSMLQYSRCDICLESFLCCEELFFVDSHFHSLQRTAQGQLALQCGLFVMRCTLSAENSKAAWIIAVRSLCLSVLFIRPGVHERRARRRRRMVGVTCLASLDIKHAPCAR